MENQICEFWQAPNSEIKECAAGIITEFRAKIKKDVRELNYTQEVCQTSKYKDCPYFLRRIEKNSAQKAL